MVFQNYHRHSAYTNPRISDSVVTNKDYAIRAAELGHGIISSCEHGWQGRYIETFELAKQYNLKFLFASEAYWVKNRFEKDDTNSHIFIAAKNENGRQAINDILSEANISGFYKRPRIDIPLLLSLPSSDVIVTTACIAYWKYEDIDDITLNLFKHFGNNFYLEVQYHNTQSQREINKHILDLSKENGIKIIMGCDSHYILESERQNRTDYLASKQINYPDEMDWYMDYPDGKTAYKRFADQCVLTHEEIIEAIENTNIFLDVEEYDNPCFTKDIKMVTLYPQLTQKERDALYINLVKEKWNEEKKNIPKEKWDLYESEIQKEINTVIETKHSDYFLVDYEIVKRGIEKGGVISSTGRGSGVSFYTNKLLGFTDVDRISAQVKMYPERFMSATRILESKSLADLDLNLANPDVFAEAQKEILGEEHSYPMIAYGTMKPKAAWKMYAKSQNIPFELANEISAQIEKYEKALIYADEEQKDEINVLDYIEERYKEIFLKSKDYLGIISDWKIAPCAYLLYMGNIRKEIGLVRAKDNLCCVMDKLWAEDYKFIKNDLLKVSVVELIDKVYKKINIRKHTVGELIELCSSSNKVWDVYKHGCVLGVNQVEQPSTRARVMKYQPKNISELCAFIAAIRPGFKSMYKIFEAREPFDYGIESFDKIIQTPEMPSTFVLYQEMAMATLNYAGIPMSECYDVVKNIAKKRKEKVLAYREQFLNGFSKVLIEKENVSDDEANDISQKIWRILEDSSQYSFNASHSYCMAIDSLYCAFLKSHYPLEFYEVFLNILEEKGEKDKMNSAKEEAEDYYKINFPPFRFRQDNTRILLDKETNSIHNSLSSIKSFGSKVAYDLLKLKDKTYSMFIELLSDLHKTVIDKSQLEKLILIDYFKEFGNAKELLMIYGWYEFLKYGESKKVAKDKIEDANILAIFQKYTNDKNKDGSSAKSFTVLDMQGLLVALEKHIKSLNIKDFDIETKMSQQLNILGYVNIKTDKEEDKKLLLVKDIVPMKSKIGGDIWGWACFTKSIGSGKNGRLTIKNSLYKHMPVYKGNIIYAKEINKNKAGFWDLIDYELRVS